MEPEVFWCSYCGKNIWAVVTAKTQPEHLICDTCKNIQNERHQNGTIKEKKNNI